MPPAEAPTRATRGAGLIALLMHLLFGVVPYAGTGLVAPGWAVITLWAIWLALLVYGIRLWRRHAAWVWAVPVAAIMVWFAVITLGEWIFGWTA